MSIIQNLSNIHTVTYKGQDCKIVHFSDACTWAKPYTLTIPNISHSMFGGCTVTRSLTKSSIGTTGTILSVSGSNSGVRTATIYHGDSISITAFSTTDGVDIVASPSSNSSVSGNITISFKIQDTINTSKNSGSIYWSGASYTTSGSNYRFSKTVNMSNYGVPSDAYNITVSVSGTFTNYTRSGRSVTVYQDVAQSTISNMGMTPDEFLTEALGGDSFTITMKYSFDTLETIS